MGYQFYPERIQHLDSEDPRMKEMADCGITLLLPGRDEEGRRICLTRVEKLNPKRFNSLDVIRLAGLILDIVAS
jgi:hypothetical protein